MLKYINCEEFRNWNRNVENDFFTEEELNKMKGNRLTNQGVEVFIVWKNSPFFEGYLVSIDGVNKYIVCIDEPCLSHVNTNRGIVTLTGHGVVINLFLDTEEFDKIYTR